MWRRGDLQRDELIEKFTIEAVGKSAGVFNPEKLLWLNAHYIKTGDRERLAGLLLPFLAERGVDPATGGPICRLWSKPCRRRSKTMLEMADGALFYYAYESGL